MNHTAGPIRRGVARRRLRAVVSALSVAAVVATGVVATAAPAGAATVGNGFLVTAGDLSYILKQIRVAERHAATLTPTDPCGTLVGPAADQIPDRLTAYGLRTVDGSCNNLFAGKETFAAADQPFPRLVPPLFAGAQPRPANLFGPGQPAGPAATTYAQKNLGNVVYDDEPRLISNLVVDQTSSNPAAVAAAGFPVRTQGNEGVVPCAVDPQTGEDVLPLTPAGCVPAHKTLFIPNVTTDVGLSPPFNSLFTFFGQFFDHGVDQTVKGSGTVFVPLRDDDPLVTLGPDDVAGTGDEVPVGQRFMVLSRGNLQPGPDGVLGTSDDVQNATNTDSPWVDQSQTYTSHASHQAFLREYTHSNGQDGVANTADDTVTDTGKFLDGPAAGVNYPGSADGAGGLASWAAIKRQAAQVLGLQLVDKDVLNVPMLATDPYGNFIPGPARGLPQYVTTSGLVEGDLDNPVFVPANVVYFDTPFLTDIAHNADPSGPKLPDADDPAVPNPDSAGPLPANEYDDEGLAAHFVCGDGRCNENIALSAIHQVFHAEHNRLVDDIKATIEADPSLNAQYRAAFTFGGRDISFGYEGRLFQAARFVTEMEYQHLVFEEFARKVQPAVRPFHVYSPDIDPATDAEFAHAVYRFGHSMLDDDVARTEVDPVTGAVTDNSLTLLEAFLNPAEYFDSGGATPYTARQAAGALVMGSSDQVGNEIDEFTTEVLRNNLLGLPLDLPVLNMTRARSEGIPPLNEVRRRLFAQTGDSQVTPYTDWSDFGNHLKHPESLINFVAAYGTHPTIASQTTVAGRRAAARAIVDPFPGDANTPADTQPCDAAAFMFGINGIDGTTCPDGLDWSARPTGLDRVDLWVGGLAEMTNVFGGLLGSTFNYVFQQQLEKLQDGDRFYYLLRTPGMNLRTQLEGNSFSELILRNTDGTHTLKSDAFATADCKFELGRLTGPATVLNPDGLPNSGDENATIGTGTVNNDPTTDCNENRLLQRSPDGTVAYRQRNTVDPPGINAQAVYNGKDGLLGDDRIKGGNDNDTVWGNAGNDVIDGQGGDDVALGGAGDDIITDLDGADVPKGGPGNDAIDAGPGDDIPMGNDGNDFLSGGANDNETFAGEGNDWVMAGQGADAVFGDGGDDWIQGGSGQDLLQGDHGAPFFDDPAETKPGNDVFVGEVGENDYDAEGGDDLMSAISAIDRYAGAGGFDWAFHQFDTAPADDDMLINQGLLTLPIQVVVNRDRWGEVEAVSGAQFNDTIRGTSDERITGGAGFIGCDALDNAGVNRIAGLRALVNTFPTALADVVAASVANGCPLTGSAPDNAAGTGVWAEGNIILGGGGSDLVEGRGNNDVIDGDHLLRVRISVRAGSNGAGAELGWTDLLQNTARVGDFGPGTAGMSLAQAMLTGKVNPGQLVAVREIVFDDGTTAGAPMGASPALNRASDCGRIVAPATTVNLAGKANCDTALYSQPANSYTITPDADGSVTVAFNGAVPFGKDDGVDTLWNVENLRFCTANDAVTGACTAFQDVLVAPTPTLSATSLTFTDRLAGTVSPTQPVTVTNSGLTPLTFSSVALTGTNPDQFRTPAPVGCTTTTVLALGQSCTVNVAFAPTTVGAKSAALTFVTNGGTVSVALTGTGITAPGAPTIGTATLGATGITVTWTPPASNGGSPITGYQVRVVNAAGTQVGALRPAAANATSLLVTGLTAGQTYRFQVQAVNAAGAGPFSALSTAVTFATAPGAPALVLATSGAIGGAVTANVLWAPPANNGGSAVTGYVISVVNTAGTVVLTTSVPTTPLTRSVTIPVAANTLVRFQVQAVNAVGTSAAATSGLVTAR